MFLEIIFTVFFFVLGSILGSFGMAMIDRLYRGEDFLKGRSYCEGCKSVLGFFDLVPIFSFLKSGGKCNKCHAKIPVSLFAAELGFGLVFALTFYFLDFIAIGFNFGLLSNIDILFQFPLVTFFIYLILFGISLVFLSDLKYLIIPSLFFWYLGVVYILGYLLFLLNPNYVMFRLFSLAYSDILWSLLAGLIMVAFFWSLYFFSKERLMGEGDVYLAGLLALFVGFRLSFVLWFGAFLGGSLVGIFLIMISKTKFKSAVPFGPFLIFGFVLAYLIGEEILEWYFLMLT